MISLSTAASWGWEGARLPASWQCAPSAPLGQGGGRGGGRVPGSRGALVEQGGSGSGADVAAAALGSPGVRSEVPWQDGGEAMAMAPEEIAAARPLENRQGAVPSDLRLLLAYAAHRRIRARWSARSGSWLAQSPAAGPPRSGDLRSSEQLRDSLESATDSRRSQPFRRGGAAMERSGMRHESDRHAGARPRLRARIRGRGRWKAERRWRRGLRGDPRLR